MVDTLKTIYSGTLGTSSTTLYTVPSSTTSIIKEIILCNKTASTVTVTLTYNGINILNNKSISANSDLPLSYHTVLGTGIVITGLASLANAIDIFISGVEIS